MANVKKFFSPNELLTYINTVTLPGAFPLDWNVVDSGGRYTTIEQTSHLVTTHFSEFDLGVALDNLVNTLEEVMPKKEGGFLTYISVADEVLGASNGFLMQVITDEAALEFALNPISASSTLIALIEHDMKFIILYTTP